MASFFLSCSTFLPLPSSHKLTLSLHHNYHLHLNFNNFQYPLGKHFTFTLYASSINKSSRSSRKVKSNEELRNDLREFLSGVGLSNDHVPTLKELSEHGRNDLANIVRRRGYKFVGELLANSTKTDCDGLIAEKGLQVEKVDNEVEDVLLSVEEPSLRNYFGSTNTDSNLNSDDNSGLPIESSANLSLKENDQYEFKGQNENMNNTVEESSSGSGLEEKASTSFNIGGQHEKKNIAENISSTNDASIEESYPCSSNVEPSPNLVQYHYTSPEASANLTLEEKVAYFIQNGDLDKINDDVYGILDERDSKEGKEVAEGGNKSGIPSAEQLQRVYNHRADGGVTLNGRDGGLAAEGLTSADFDKDLDIETGRIENQLRINDLKSMLQQKEFELSQLKEQIEKEQLALSLLQTEAETEIAKAQKLISEKDAELNAVEESLSELEEVEVQYSGDGEIVEVAGSFNGWCHRVKMDPKPSSSIIETIGSRKSRTWSTVLWLYPGMYEIKFIVDGEWKTDPQRESVTHSGILNNILRVNR